MKIILDTEKKQTICPAEFFDYIRNINDASELTGSNVKITPENYLEKIITECSKVIRNKSELKKVTRSKSTKQKLADITINPAK